MESAPFVSIVTPFFNTREFLGECIESVVRQTYENWEYVLVDNCSTDGSSEIATRYASEFPGKIRLIRTASFLSQIENYNFALSCISPLSKYCKMVQADDWIFPDCVRSMVEVAEAHPSVGIVASFVLEGEYVAPNGLLYPSFEVPGRDICRLYFLRHKYLFATPTSLLMRSELIRSRHPFYDERYDPFEDVHVCFELLKAWNFGFVHQVLAYSRRDNESILSRIAPLGFLGFVRLSTVITHGRDCLSEEEWARCLKEAERDYFLFLGKSAFHGRDRAFWNFHRERLASINYSLDWRLFARWIPVALFEYVGNPRTTCGYFWQRRGKARAILSRLGRRAVRIFGKNGLSARS